MAAWSLRLFLSPTPGTSAGFLLSFFSLGPPVPPDPPVPPVSPAGGLTEPDVYIGIVSVLESAFEGVVIMIMEEVLTPEKERVHERPTLSPEPPSPPSMLEMVWVELPEERVAPEGRESSTPTLWAAVSPQF